MTTHRHLPNMDAGPERSPDHDDATVRMPRLPTVEPQDQEDDEAFDPESTLVREDWESTVIRRVAPHVAAVQSAVGEDSDAESRFGWEAAVLRRLAHEVQKVGG